MNTKTVQLAEYPEFTYEELQYEDPHPGKKGAEIVKDPCHCGDGVYHAPSRVVWDNGRGETKWCFSCNGAAYIERSVATLRRRERAMVKATNEARRLHALSLAEAPMRHQAEVDEAHATALIEDARRAALVSGFVGMEGDKVTNLKGRIDYQGTWETPSYSGYGTEVKSIVIITLTDGKVVKIVGTSATYFGWTRDDLVTIVRGVVKGTGNYNGQDQTILTRAKLSAE